MIFLWEVDKRERMCFMKKTALVLFMKYCGDINS